MQDVALVGGAGLVSLLLALAVAVAVPKPNFTLTVGVILGSLVVVALVANTRLEWSVGFVVVFLGCLNGPVKLISSGGIVSSALQDVLVLAVCIGVLARVIAARRPVSLPPLFGWVFAFIMIVLIEAFNPKTSGALKIIAGYRQQLEWVPFFFFGYLVMRSKERFRKAFLLLGVIALANAAVSTVQTQLSPGQLASWGPGYEQRVFGRDARKYISEGEAHVRPLGLGSDSGFSGGVAVIALPATLALLAVLRKRRWLAMLLCFGAILAAVTSLGRLQLGGTLLSGLAFAFLSVAAGRRLGRPLVAALAIMALAVPVLAVFVSAVGEGVFSRYASLAPGSAATTATSYKENDVKTIPHEISSAPFGFGLATAGAVSGFGGKATELLEGHNVTAETQPNFLVKELGLPGLLVWYGFLIRLIVLAFRRLRDIKDLELQAYLAAACAPLIAFLFMSYDGPVSASAAAGPFFWFAGGIIAYWLAGPGLKRAREGLDNGGLTSATVATA